MKCSFPQKVHASLRGAVSASEGAAGGRRCVLLIAATMDFVNSAKMVPSCAVLTTGSRVEGEGEGAVDERVSQVERVL